jgi:hypothetical protein
MNYKITSLSFMYEYHYKDPGDLVYCYNYVYNKFVL